MENKTIDLYKLRGNLIRLGHMIVHALSKGYNKFEIEYDNEQDDIKIPTGRIIIMAKKKFRSTDEKLVAHGNKDYDHIDDEHFYDKLSDEEKDQLAQQTIETSEKEFDKHMKEEHGLSEYLYL